MFAKFLSPFVDQLVRSKVQSVPLGRVISWALALNFGGDPCSLTTWKPGILGITFLQACNSSRSKLREGGNGKEESDETRTVDMISCLMQWLCFQSGCNWCWEIMRNRCSGPHSCIETKEMRTI